MRWCFLRGNAVRHNATTTDRLTEPTIRPSCYTQTLSPYDAVSSLDTIASLPKDVTPLKLDWNESCVPPSPKVVEAIQKYLGNSHHLNWYPDITTSSLRDSISRYTGVTKEQVLVTNGSDEALDLLCRTYLDSNDDVVMIWPTYSHFLIFARSRGVSPRMATPFDLFGSMLPALLATIRPSTKMVYLASPNNPTGTILTHDELKLLSSSFPTTLFIVDEAYYEFCDKSVTPMLETIPNLAVTRTFSKCFGIAGLRVGYLLTSEAILEEIKKIHNPKSVNTLGQIAACAAIQDIHFRNHYIDQVTKARTQLVTDLKARGAMARETAGNYILISLDNPTTFVQSLEKVGVFVRDRSKIPGFEGFVRITIGTPEQMTDLIQRIDALRQDNPDLLKPMKTEKNHRPRMETLSLL